MPISEQLIAEFLARTGYALEPRVEMPGEASLRGQVVDVFPAGSLAPVRVEHENGRIIQLTSYDPDTQRTTGELKVVVLEPASEIIHSAVPQVPQGVTVASSIAQHYGTSATLFDYIPGAHIIADPRTGSRVSGWLQQIKEGYEARRATGDCVSLEPPTSIFLDELSWAAALGSHKLASLSPSAPVPHILVPKFALEPSPTRTFRRFIQQQLAANHRVLLTAASDSDLKAIERRASSLGNHRPEHVSSIACALALPAGSIAALRVDLDVGFILRDRGTAVIAAADLLGSRAAHEVPIGYRDQGTFLEHETLQPGDVVVHRERGVAILRGLENVSAAGMPERDMIRLEFADQATVLVPVEELGSVWKYGSEANVLSLDHADGSTWTRRCEALEDTLAESARHLVALARERETCSAPKLIPPPVKYERFASRFPFFATPDQAQAIQDVLEDLGSGHLMDRLLCGDVGFGKTEVALRAAAATALSGKQIAVVVPTTVLARQHTSTFSRRFAGFGIEVGHLSRSATPAQAREVKNGMATGAIRIVIGTHAIASKSIQFHDLGLLIIDEEQRFGARDKEKLRTLGQTVHVLTMTATPIPRTLRLASVGLQSLSALATAPARRLPVRTSVEPWAQLTVARAIRYEHLRGGQSFVVCPRIEDITPIKEQLREIVPELKLLVLHGRMPTQAIDATMLDFAEGRGSVLLTTNIIESGLDIPRANTMIVWRPERFGLAQLHQLRGRVGRGSRRGFAFFLLDPAAKYRAEAIRRLKMIEQHAELSAGFVISERDMNLRGAGSLSGKEQAGHLKLVGSELYRHLMSRAVRKARGEKLSNDDLPELRVGMSGSIPFHYVGDDVIRIEVYSRIAKAQSERVLDQIEDELQDRFGPIPPEVEELIAIAKIRVKCRSLRIERVDAGPHGIAFDFREVPLILKTADKSSCRLHWHDHRLLLDRPVQPHKRIDVISELLDTLANNFRLVRAP